MLREAARRVGVSAAAAYRHFATRDVLLAHVQRHTAAALSACVLESVGRVARDGDQAERAVARLRAAGEGYLIFAAAQPGLFAAAFARTGHAGADGTRGFPSPSSSPEPVLKHRALAALAAILGDLVALGLMDPAHRPGAEIAAWSTIHGLTVLSDGPLRGMAPAARAVGRQRTFDAVVTCVTAGRDPARRLQKRACPVRPRDALGLAAR